MYSPLETTSFVPDVTVFICNPKQVMILTQAYLYKVGGRLESSIVGMQSLCSEGIVQVYKEGKIGVAVCCIGSRSNTKIEEGEMVMGIPVELLADVVSGLKEHPYLHVLQQGNQTKLEEKTEKLSEIGSKIPHGKIEDTEKIVDLSQAKPVEITEIRKLMPCITDPSKLRIIANMTPPLSGILRIFETLFSRSRYVDRTHSLMIQKEETIITIYSSGKVSIGMIKNEIEAKQVLEELKNTINEAIKIGVVPTHREKDKVEVMEIYKYLPQTNCGKCSQEDCYSFAVKLMAGEATLDGCTILKEPKYVANKEHLQVLTANIEPLF
jgi:ArsR family metal-binding transcriptional regulator